MAPHMMDQQDKLEHGIAPKAYTTPHIYDTIEEPKLLQEMLENDIYYLGGQFALLCQLAHPGLAKAVSIHSDFVTRMMSRLRNTARFINSAVYATTEEKAAIFSVIHRSHSPIKGDGYDANDPELQKWTAATLFVSYITVHEAIFGKLPREKIEAIFRQCAVFGTSLRMPPDMWPATLDDFWAYWEHNMATLTVTDTARQLSRDLLHPKKVPIIVRLGAPVARLLTVNWLPKRMAEEFHVQPTRSSQLLFRAAVRSLRAVYPKLPLCLRGGMQKRYRKDLKEAIDKIERTGRWDSKSILVEEGVEREDAASHPAEV